MRPQSFKCDTNRLRLLLDNDLPSSKESEVVEHLDRCEECRQTLEKLAADKSLWDELPQLRTMVDPRSYEPRPSGSGEHGHRPLPPAAGDWLGDFLDPADGPQHLGRLAGFAVESLLGRGGMGVVLKAFDASLNRPVAIKVLAPYFASSAAARKRFEREARAAATVVHPHVIPIHGVASWKELPYLVMACVEGKSLQERLDASGPLDVKEIVRIAMQTASGLAAAHAQGLVHRDVKPANILLENGVGRVWLTDFGLARAVDDASLTQSGVIAGTPQYMSPEQARGDTVDHRADLFSLGSTMYTMCTGHPPFRAESAMAVLRRVCDDSPRSIRSLNPDIPSWLVQIVEKLLAKKPADRFADAGTVAVLLEKCLAHLHQPESLPLPQELARPAQRTRKILRRTLVTCVAVLCIAAVGWRWLPLGHFFAADRAGDRAGESPAPVAGKVASLSIDDNSVERQVNEVRGRTAALAADLHHGAEGQGDPADLLLQQTRSRLEALERELTVARAPK